MAEPALHSPQLGDYRYRVSSTGASSLKYGNCQVCAGHASEVFMQTEERAYRIEHLNRSGWTQSGCHVLFGHLDCLRSRRRSATAAIII